MKNYYKQHGLMTSLDSCPWQYTTLDEMVDIVQGHLIHQAWASRYGVAVTDERKRETFKRSMKEKMIWITSQDKKMFGICRDFAVFLTALLREKNISARTRCGFATYFEKDKYIDHWIVEYFDEVSNHWIRVDPQIDDLQKQILNIDFDTKNIPQTQFVSGAKAWLMCRQTDIDPNRFGIFEWWGYNYLRTNLILDAHALLKLPMHPWDQWGGLKSLDVELWTKETYLILDELARVILKDDIEMLRNFVDSYDELIIPESFYS